MSANLAVDGFSMAVSNYEAGQAQLAQIASAKKVELTCSLLSKPLSD
ncbi:hypothetical protein [Marinobacter halotolerans]|nr:hypothetical protein [Marinobacter halotolerans]